ncbi:hypothetical protein [uncultured Clostridium sp.]|uniref:hypothetical protein n=1 Tax=uncultured Clostridium sp. TaxID=59620 RepID=UPI0026F234E0|nr:hypothetical protein [uncultured Clostridium sp.]
MSEANIDNRNLVEQKIKENDVSVYAYDLAVVNDFRARFKQPPVSYSDVNSNVVMAGPDQAFQVLGQMDNDKIVMPFISVQRLNWQLNLDRQMSQTFIGDKIIIQNPENPLERLEVRAQVIPITINYQLDVWTKDRITNDALVRELLWYYHLRPTLLVNVLHGLNMKHTFNIMFNSEVEDNSDIHNQNNRGNIVRSTLSFFTEDAYLWKAHHQPIVGIDVNTNFYYDLQDDYKIFYNEKDEPQNKTGLD